MFRSSQLHTHTHTHTHHGTHTHTHTHTHTYKNTQAFDPQARVFIIASYVGYAQQLICKVIQTAMHADNIICILVVPPVMQTLSNVITEL